MKAVKQNAPKGARTMVDKSANSQAKQARVNRSYFDIPDKHTSDGSGDMEQVLQAFGQVTPSSHWMLQKKNPHIKKGFGRAHGVQVDGGATLVDICRNFNTPAHAILGVDNTQENKVVVKNFFEKIARPSMKTRQKVRVAKRTGTKAERISAQRKAEFEEWTSNPEALQEYVITQHADVINVFKKGLEGNSKLSGKAKDQMLQSMVEDMAKQLLDSRKPTEDI